MTTQLFPFLRRNRGKQIATFLTLFLVLSLALQPTVSPALASPGSGYSIAISHDPSILDPAQTTDPSAWLVTRHVYDTLVEFEPGSSRVRPGLASAWSTSPDGKTWTFTIPAGVKFQDGIAANASAVLYNFKRWWDPADPHHNPGNYPTFADLLGYKGSNSLITSLSAPSSTQFVIVLKEPTSLLAILAMPAFGIASPKAIAAGTLSNQPVGSGPFQLNKRTAGTAIFLDAYANYRGPAALPANLTFKVLPSSASQLTALQSQTVWSAGDLSGTDLTQAQNDPTLSVLWRPSTAIGYLGINQAKTPLNNLLVRQAIAHAINKAALLAGQNTPGLEIAGQFLPPILLGYDPALSDYSYDPALAKSLLAQAGYPNGFTVELAYRIAARGYLPNPVDAVNKIVADLAAVKITATPNLYDSTDFVNKVNAGDLALYLLGWTGDYPHPNNFFPYHFCNPDNLQFGQTMDTTLCGLVSSALTQPGEAQQQATYQAASDRVHDTLPLIPLFNPRNPLAINRNLGGVIPSPIQMESYQFAFTISDRVYLPLTQR